MFLEDSKWWTVRYKNGGILSCHRPLVPPLSFLLFFYVFIFVISSKSKFLSSFYGLSGPNKVHATEPASLHLGNRTHTFSNEKEDKRFCPFLSCTFWHMWSSWLEQFTFFIVYEKPKLWLSETSDRPDSAETHFATYHMGAMELKLL